MNSIYYKKAYGIGISTKNYKYLSYYDQLREVLKLRNASDLCYCDEKDLSRIGMSRPEQKRLQNEYTKNFVQNSSIVVKLRRKVFGTKNELTNKPQSPNSSIITNDQHIIPIESIALCKELGKGEFGCVYQAAWHLQDGSNNVLQVAVKRVLPEKLIANPTNFLQEAAIMTRMRHENVVRLYGVVLDTKALMLVCYLLLIYF